MEQVTRTIERDGPMTWKWTLGHDSRRSEEERRFLSCRTGLIQPQEINAQLVTYVKVPGNESVADAIMREHALDSATRNIVKMSVFMCQSRSSQAVDSSTLERTKAHLYELSRMIGAGQSLRYLINLLDHIDVVQEQGSSGTDVTVGLGRIVLVCDADDVVALSPPDGLHPNGLFHQSRVLGELMLFGTLYRLGNKANVEACRKLYQVMKEAGWIQDSQLLGAVIAIIDHGRRRMKGESIPPRTLESTIAIAAGYAKSGFSGFERILN